MLDKLDWPALKLTAAEVRNAQCAQVCLSQSLTYFGEILQLGVADLPDEVPESAKDDEEFLKSVHDLVIDVSASDGDSDTLCRRVLTCRLNCVAAYQERGTGLPPL